MYTITVDDKDLYIPDSEDYQVSSATISINTDSVAYLDMDIPCTNKGLKEIKQQASIVRVYDNDVLRYKMFVDNIDYDFDNTAKVSCTSVLAYLKDSLVRPYSTVDSEEGITAPSSVNGYFSWLIEQHNKNIRDTKKYFYVGVNQGAMMDRNNHIYRASTEVPTTSDEIKNKILDTYGAYISLTFNGDLNVINLYADVHDSNEQVIDFGVNLLDLTKSVNTESSYTAVRPTGAVPKTENNSTSLPITISSIPDGLSKWSSDVYKKGDVVYSISGVRDYGYKECEYSNTDITDVEYLYRASVAYLSKLVNPYLTIDVKAVDLSLLYMDKYSPMEVGQAVRVRSEPHGVDEYLRISEITIDLLDPSNDSYTLGESYDSLTGQQSSYMKKLNSSINASFDIVGSAADAASKLADAAKKTANEADKKAQDATSKANDANTKANEANSKADTATETANSASTKADQANTKADTATETANSASTKADQASQNAQKANEAAKKAQEDATAAIGSAKDAADKAASASQKADDNTAKITTVENTIKTISGDTATAIANAKAAQAAADAAKKAADQAQSDASTANTEIGKVQSQVGTINTEIGNIKQEATDLRDDLSGQITTVKNTMEADYTRKTELSDTTATLRNEISESAAGVIHTVSQDYATKKELKTTTDATNKNAADLTNAINKFNSDVDNLQGQIDGAIETWFYEVDPTDKNEPAVNWTTDTLKKAHLGDLYYNTVSGYCWRYQLQNGSYSWSRITDVDVTKALADAAAAQTTANSKKRIFVATPNPPYDVGDLWTQGSTGDIMRCQTAKTSSQSYAAADWVKASKYTDDTAVTKLSNTVEKTYSTKTEVKQLSDQVSSTVSSLETVRISAEAAQTSADNAKKAADAAQTAADTAKDNAATAQSKADEAAKNLATAEQNLKTLQSQANATDEQLTAAKAEVEKAKTAAATAQSTANTAKSNAATAQATADTAKANAKTAQDDVDALKNRVTSAETSIKQNSDAIALRATKTEVTSAIDGINVGGRNLARNTSNEWSDWITPKANSTNATASSGSIIYFPTEINVGDDYYVQCEVEFDNVTASDGKISYFYLQGSVDGKWEAGKFNPWSYWIKNIENGIVHFSVKKTSNVKPTPPEVYADCGFRVDDWATGRYRWRRIKVELGNKPTDWSPAPEDLVAKSVNTAFDSIEVGAANLISNSENLSRFIVENSSKATWIDNVLTRLDVAAGAQSHYGIYYDVPRFAPGETYTLSVLLENVTGVISVSLGGNQDLWGKYGFMNITKSGRVSYTRTLKKDESKLRIYFSSQIANSSAKIIKVKLEKGNKATDWSPAPEDLQNDATMKADNALASAKTYTDAQLKISADSITSIVSKTYATKTDLETTNGNVMKAQNAADGVKNDLANNYTTTVDMNSKIEQTANSIKSEVSETYQPKGDYATNSSVRSAIEQSATSITSTVSKTYATKTSVDTLQNIADNAIESWYLAGVPIGTNKPASDWTTDTLKKQHIGDMYYDKDTGYSYRWLQEGTAYKWIQIKDNDITTTNAVANEAKSTADTAKAGVESLTTRVTSAETKIEQNSDAIALRATKTEVTEVKATADTAKSTAESVKTNLETNYSTTTQMNSAIDLKTDSIKSEVSLVKNTADSALSKATSVEQTATDLTTKITTAQNTANTANSNAATAQNTANTANSTANAAQTAANTLETLIRQSEDGVEVAKKVNGEYTSTKTLMSDDGVHIQDQLNNDLASFTKNKIQLGKNSRDSIIELCDGNGRIKSSKTNYIQLESDGLASLQSARDNGAYNGIATVFAQAMPTDEDCYSYIGLEVTSKKSGSADSPGAQIALESTKTADSKVSSIILMADSIYFSNSSSSYGQLSMENVRNSMLVAQGTSGNWYYRKWVSGYAECWGFFPYSFTEFRWWTSQSYVKYTYPAFSSVLYPFTFKEEPALYAEYKPRAAQSGIVVLGYNNSVTTSTGEINVMIPDYNASGSGEGIIYIHAFGKY